MEVCYIKRSSVLDYKIRSDCTEQKKKGRSYLNAHKMKGSFNEITQLQTNLIYFHLTMENEPAVCTF
jgi:hypothetical protein